MATVIQITITTDDSGRIRFDTDAEVKDNLAGKDFEIHADEAMDVANDAEVKYNPADKAMDVANDSPTLVTIKAIVTTYADERTIKRTAEDILTPLAEDHGATIDSIEVAGRGVTVKGRVDSYLDREELVDEIRSILADAVSGQPVRIDDIAVS